MVKACAARIPGGAVASFQAERGEAAEGASCVRSLELLSGFRTDTRRAAYEPDTRDVVTARAEREG